MILTDLITLTKWANEKWRKSAPQPFSQRASWAPERTILWVSGMNLKWVTANKKLWRHTVQGINRFPLVDNDVSSFVTTSPPLQGLGTMIVSIFVTDFTLIWTLAFPHRFPKNNSVRNTSHKSTLSSLCDRTILLERGGELLTNQSKQQITKHTFKESFSK